MDSNGLYYKWHQNPHHHQIHLGILAITILALAISFSHLLPFEQNYAQAAGITKYARTAGGNWSADATWSTTSGGGADTVKPTTSDDVVFDVNSGNVTIDATAVAKTLVQTGYTNVLTHGDYSCSVSGNVTLLSGKYVAQYDTSSMTVLKSGAILTTGNNAMGNFSYSATTSMTLGDNWIGRASKSITFSAVTGSIDLNGKTVSGDSSINRILVKSSTVGTPRTITVNGGTFANADFQDIAFANGGANLDLSAITGLSGDCGGNSMSGGGTLTFAPAATQTFASTGGNWSDAANWTSRVPLTQDNVSFGTMIAGQTITVDMPRLPDTDFSSATNTPTVNLTTAGLSYTVYGNYNLTGVGTYACNLSFTFGARANSTMTSNGKTTSTTSVTVQMLSATLTFNDAFKSDLYFSLVSGTITTNYSVNMMYYYSSAGTTTNMGSGTWTIRGRVNNEPWTVIGTLNAQTSTLLFAPFATGSYLIPMVGHTYNNITIAPGAGILTFSDAFTFANMTMASAGTKTVKFTKSTTYTMTGTNFLNGTAGNLVTVDSDDGATQFTLTKASGTIIGDYLNMSRAAITGTGKW
jgi:hypothetical protein